MATEYAFKTLRKRIVNLWQPFPHYNTEFRNVIFFTFFDKTEDFAIYAIWADSFDDIWADIWKFSTGSD